MRDSKFVASIVYISSIILVMLALVTFGLRTYVNIGTGILAAGILLLTTITLALIFIPKVRNNMANIYTPVAETITVTLGTMLSGC